MEENNNESGKAAKKVKYRVNITCYDGVRLLHEDEVVEYPADKKLFCPEHFTKI